LQIYVNVDIYFNNKCQIGVYLFVYRLEAGFVVSFT